MLAGREGEVNKALHLYAATELRKAYGAGGAQLASFGKLDCWMYVHRFEHLGLEPVYVTTCVGTLYRRPWSFKEPRRSFDPIVGDL